MLISNRIVLFYLISIARKIFLFYSHCWFCTIKEWVRLISGNTSAVKINFWSSKEIGVTIVVRSLLFIRSWLKDVKWIVIALNWIVSWRFISSDTAHFLLVIWTLGNPWHFHWILIFLRKRTWMPFTWAGTLKTVSNKFPFIAFIGTSFIFLIYCVILGKFIDVMSIFVNKRMGL